MKPLRDWATTEVCHWGQRNPRLFLFLSCVLVMRWAVEVHQKFLLCIGDVVIGPRQWQDWKCQELRVKNQPLLFFLFHEHLLWFLISSVHKTQPISGYFPMPKVFHQRLEERVPRKGGNDWQHQNFCVRHSREMMADGCVFQNQPEERMLNVPKTREWYCDENTRWPGLIAIHGKHGI